MLLKSHSYVIELAPDFEAIVTNFRAIDPKDLVSEFASVISTKHDSGKV